MLVMGVSPTHDAWWRVGETWKTINVLYIEYFEKYRVLGVIPKFCILKISERMVMMRWLCYDRLLFLILRFLSAFGILCFRFSFASALTAFFRS